jgi:hypothetical protein
VSERYQDRGGANGDDDAQEDQGVRDVNRECEELIERSIFASAMGNQAKARELNAELVRLKTLRADLETRSRAGRTIINLLQP